MTTKPITFPQHATKPTEKPRTIASILETAKDSKMTHGQTMALVSAAFPQATVGEVADALKVLAAEGFATRKRLLAEEELDLHIFDLCEPVMAAGRADTVNEALRVLAYEGHAEAATCFAQINSPEQDAFWRDFALAVDADPYWTIHPDNSFECKDGATHTTAEELVAAYRRNHRLEREDSQ